MKTLLLCTMLASSLALSGCVISIGDKDSSFYGADWQEREQRNRDFISNLSVGVSRSSVLAELGAADFTELTTSNVGTIQTLYYRTQRIEDDGVTTKDECTPLVFVDGSLTGYGAAELAKYL